MHNWLRRFQAEGADGLVERSRRPRTSPTRLSAEVEAVICELRRAYPRWGPRRIAYELGLRGVTPAPGRTTVYRVLVRNGLVEPHKQTHRRSYKRWQREAPMQLWQIDIMSGIFLAGGRECKLVTGIDDHSRFVVMAQVVAEPSGRAVCQAFTDAMGRYGVPSEVLTDNGKQFTGRFTKPFPAEVLFERICRENGITSRFTAPVTHHDGEDRKVARHAAPRTPGWGWPVRVDGRSTGQHRCLGAGIQHREAAPVAEHGHPGVGVPADTRQPALAHPGQRSVTPNSRGRGHDRVR